MSKTVVPTVVVGVVMASAILAALILPMGWVVMLLLGALHSAWPVVPALGFGSSIALFALCGILIKSNPTVSKSD